MRAEPRETRRRTLVAVAVCAAVALSLGICASAGASGPNYECPPTVAGCTSIVGGWIDVPPTLLPRTGVFAPGTTQDQLTCPSGVPVGFTYEGGDGTSTNVSVQIYQSYPNWNNVWNPVARGTVFFWINNWGKATTVRDRIGCAPSSAAAATRAQASRLRQVERIWAVRLRPSRDRSYTHGCPGGTRLVNSDAIVEFLTDRRPSRSQLTAVSWSSTEHRSAVTVRVRTSSRLRTKRAELRMILFCAIR